jgi:hypothetical protein
MSTQRFSPEFKEETVRQMLELVDQPDGFVGWVERSETRRNTASGAHSGFRCAPLGGPTLPNHLDDLLSTRASC